MATKVNAPPYVEFGARATAPGPFLCSGGKFRGMLLKGDRGRIQDYCDQALNGPARGAMEYRALTGFVMLLIGEFANVSALSPPFDEMGGVTEVQASFWVPLVAGRQNGARFQVDRAVMAVPYILVDNPMSYAGGREAYGYPKSLGRFDLSHGVGGTMAVEAYGGSFGRDSMAGWKPFLKIGRSGGDGGREPEPTHLTGTDAVIGDVAKRVREEEGDAGHRSTFEWIKQAIEDALAGRSMQVFLKQFRDAGDPAAACYQEVIEAGVQVRDVSADFSLAKWDFHVEPLDSHPLERDLGVGTQTTRLTYALDIDFVVQSGVAITPRPLVA
jgi:hypothetical protein